MFFDLLFPPICTFCQETLAGSDLTLCVDCMNRITNNQNEDFCPKCGIVTKATDFSKCPECDVRRFLFDRALPLGEYSGALRVAVIRLKNFSQFPLARSIGRLMSQRLEHLFSTHCPDLVIPIPKFWMKRFIQGTNSTEFLAQEIAVNAKLPYFANALRWIRNIKKQSLLSVTERNQNVRGALELSDRFDLDGTHVLLVDDTLTTGSTANEATRCLRKAGVSEVTVAVVGRASHH